MMPIVSAPAVLFALLSWLSAPPVSLAEAAHKERLRRQLVGKSRNALTNESLPEWTMVSAPPVEAPPPPETSATPPPAETAATPPAQSAAAATSQTPPQDEEAWRNRMTTARAALERNQVLADAMQVRVNSLQTDFVNRDDPAQREEIRRQLQRSLAELERLKQQIARDEKSIKDIQNEARRSGIPAGWVR
jgi:hypothetical protein